MISASSLRVVRGGNVVLPDLTFAVDARRIVGLLGPSGCGKSTLMRSIVGTQRITSGSITVLDHPAGDPSLRNRIGYASQQASVYVDLTVLENLRYFAATLNARADVDRVIEQVDLTRHRGRLTGSLSGGERSRVSLAVALLGTPELLILDEPTVGLDPVLREDLWTLFAQLRDSGLTLLVSSHVMEEAERCDELLLMREGRLLAQESPASLKQRTGADTMDRAFLALIAQDSAA